MVDISIRDNKLIVDVKGLHQLLAFKRRIEVSLDNVYQVYTDPTVKKNIWKGVRAPGTHIPWVLVAGTFYMGGERHFWDVFNAKKAIIIELENETYDRLIVEVDDPEETARRIATAV